MSRRERGAPSRRALLRGSVSKSSWRRHPSGSRTRSPWRSGACLSGRASLPRLPVHAYAVAKEAGRAPFESPLRLPESYSPCLPLPKHAGKSPGRTGFARICGHFPVGENRGRLGADSPARHRRSGAAPSAAASHPAARPDPRAPTALRLTAGCAPLPAPARAGASSRCSESILSNRSDCALLFHRFHASGRALPQGVRSESKPQPREQRDPQAAGAHAQATRRLGHEPEAIATAESLDERSPNEVSGLVVRGSVPQPTEHGEQAALAPAFPEARRPRSAAPRPSSVPRSASGLTTTALPGRARPGERETPAIRAPRPGRGRPRPERGPREGLCDPAPKTSSRVGSQADVLRRSATPAGRRTGASPGARRGPARCDWPCRREPKGRDGVCDLSRRIGRLRRPPAGGSRSAPEHAHRSTRDRSCPGQGRAASGQ